MSEQKQLAIYGAERLFANRDSEWYHAFLILMDESHAEGGNGDVVEQLHFSDGVMGDMSPNIQEGFSRPDHLKRIDLFRYAAGDEASILPRWNFALKYANYVATQSVPFSSAARGRPEGNNCRSGVKAAVEAMGFSFNEEFARSAAGINSNKMPSYWTFDSAKEQGSIEDMRSTHERLRKPLVTIVLG